MFHILVVIDDRNSRRVMMAVLRLPQDGNIKM